MERVIYSPKFGAVEGVSPIVRGATDADNAPQAVANLGLVPQSSLGAAGGFAMLDANGDLQRNQLPSGLSKATRVDGPVAVLPNSRSIFTITNFDMETTYTLEEGPDVKITKGTGGVLYVDVMGSGNTWIKVNGTTYPIAVVETSPATPTIIAPVNGSVRQPFEILLTSAAFAMVSGSLYSDVHEASEWQLSADPTFPETDATTVNFSYTDLTTWAISGLSDVATYYVRMRHQGKTYGMSPWSDTVGFTTRSMLPSDIKAYATDPSLESGDYLGYSISGNANATIVAVGAPLAGGDADLGKVIIFFRSGTIWTKIQELSEPNTNWFGCSVSMSKDGSTLAVGSQYDIGPEYPDTPNTPGPYPEGSVYIYYSVNGVWGLSKKIKAPQHPTYRVPEHFGASVSLSGNGEVLFVGAPNAIDEAVTKHPGALYIFTKAANWELVQTHRVTMNGGARLGHSVDCNYDGSLVAVGAPFFTPWPHLPNIGTVAVLIKSENGWIAHPELDGFSNTDGGYTGISVGVSDDGNTIFTGASNNRGMVWKKTNGVWNWYRLGGTAETGVFYMGSVSVSSDGNVLVYADRNPGFVNNSYRHYTPIFTAEFKNGAWVDTLIWPTPTTGYSESKPGHALLISDDKKVIVASCLPEGPNNQGTLYVFS